MSIGRTTTICRSGLFVLLALSSPTVGTSQATGLPAPASEKPTCPPATPNALVTEAYKSEFSSDSLDRSSGPHVREVKLRDIITLRVANLGTLMAQLECANQDGRTRHLVLFLDQRPLRDVVPEPPTNPSHDLLKFPLKRTEAAREVWAGTLGKPSWEPRKTAVSVGIEDRFAVPSEATVQLEVLPHGWFIFWGFLFFLSLIVFLRLALKSAMIRDDAPEPSNGKGRPYSLARTQAAIWFFIILASYLFIGMVTGDFSTSITGTVLVLLGISGVTAVSSAVIDASKDTPEEAAKQNAALVSVANKLPRLDAALTASKVVLAANPDDPAARETYATLAAQRETLETNLNKLTNRSESFLRDILSDANGVNFHRFQMLVWTIVLGIVFVVEVVREVAMPQFSQTLLTLMGISSGTYLGMKLPEPTVPKTQ